MACLLFEWRQRAASKDTILDGEMSHEPQRPTKRKRQCPRSGPRIPRDGDSRGPLSAAGVTRLPDVPRDKMARGEHAVSVVTKNRQGCGAHAGPTRPVRSSVSKVTASLGGLWRANILSWPVWDVMRFVLMESSSAVACVLLFGTHMFRELR
ncbi:hypothetical protein P4O66_021808 [Electrophorus voltai]|uniref:Uncharacterized protein n=1 Tax=Electrophorus voltai TaxID=2609070 RepID=A0AAD8ZS59_9TELE|nr:hypothetical protein P4O66_021808 [Electrophorus voltai]